MRTFILSFIVLAVSCNFAFANNLESGITIAENKIVTINLSDYPEGEIQMFIVDNDGHQLYSEQLNTRDYSSRSYSLAQLPYGKYAIKINTAQRIFTKEIDVERRNIQIHEDITTFKPVIDMEENKWNVNFLAQNNETLITISNGVETLHTETIKNKMGIFKSYDLSSLDQGTYYMTIESGDNSYTEKYTKN